MKAKILHFSIIFSSLFILLAGCATPDSSVSIGSGPKRIELFRDGQKPNRLYKEIGLLTDDGALGEQGDIEAKFIKKAKKMGADALILSPLVKTGGELKGFGIVDTYLYKASAIVYDGAP